MNPNIVKGLLILLVMVDHNDFARSVIPGFLLGFSFHVLGFLTLPFLRPAAALDRRLLQYAFRLYHPFFVLTTVLSLVVLFITPVTFPQQCRLWLLSLYSGNFSLLKDSTHMSMLWYLPSFVSLVVLRAVIEHMGKAAKWAILAALVILHPFIGLAPDGLADFLPLGLLPVLYAIPLCYLAAAVHDRLLMRWSRIAAVGASVALLSVVKYLQIRANLPNELGAAAVADYTQPYALLINDLEAVAGVWMIFQLGRLQLGSFIEVAGKYSLQVYCFHAFMAAAIYKTMVRTLGSWDALPLFLMSVALTAVISVVVCRYLAERPWFRRVMFPRDTGELRQALRFPLPHRVQHHRN
jgi:fucose 4-O-acetylase-like acetyltransferase